MTKILLLEDDISLIDGLEYTLQKNDFAVETVRSASEARRRLHSIDQINQYSLLLLDVTLPDGTGFDICEQVRKLNRFIPIIFLTASDEEVNVIRGLDGGGDDYITKPFKLGELCSRIRALLRRTALEQHAPLKNAVLPQTMTDATADTNETLITSGNLTIDTAASRALLGNEPLDLTLTEYRLLSLLVRNADRVVTRDIIFDALWDNTGNFVDDNTLSVYIRRLREKIEQNPSHPNHLITVRGFGYRWIP